MMLKGAKTGVPDVSAAAGDWLRVQHARLSIAGERLNTDCLYIDLA
jgi:hypothetical protein